MTRPSDAAIAKAFEIEAAGTWPGDVLRFIERVTWRAVVAAGVDHFVAGDAVVDIDDNGLITCPKCASTWQVGTEQATCIDLHGECIPCRFLPEGARHENGSGSGTKVELDEISRRTPAPQPKGGEHGNVVDAEAKDVAGETGAVVDPRAFDYYRSAFLRIEPSYLPSRVRIAKTVRGDGPFARIHVKPGDYPCESNRYGALSVRTESGELLGIKPGEFEPIGWVASAPTAVEGRS